MIKETMNNRTDDRQSLKLKCQVQASSSKDLEKHTKHLNHKSGFDKPSLRNQRHEGDSIRNENFNEN